MTALKIPHDETTSALDKKFDYALFLKTFNGKSQLIFKNKFDYEAFVKAFKLKND